MISPWANIQVRVQRRPSNPVRNALNEPVYGDESEYSVVYDMVWVRIEFVDEELVFTETGERVTLKGATCMYVEPDFIIKPMDRIIVQTGDNPSLIGQLYLAHSVYSEFNSVNNVHHYIIELQTH